MESTTRNLQHLKLQDEELVTTAVETRFGDKGFSAPSLPLQQQRAELRRLGNHDFQA
jgi:hypothetical protein